MKFNHLFFDSSVNFKAIPKRRIALSVVIGLISAFFIYCFFSLFRELFRMLNLDFENRPIVISEVSRTFHNLFFASISLIFGNSIAVAMLLSRPQSVMSKRNIKRGRILNDQVFLAFNFIYWFGKVWVLLGVFSFFLIGFDYIENLMIPSIFLILVLYLESWKTLIQVIRKHRWKIQLIHFITLTILTLALSHINVIDYKAIDASYLEKNPTIDVPESLYNDNRIWDYDYQTIVFKIDFVTKNEIGFFTSENEKIELSQIFSVMKKLNPWISEHNIFRSKLKLRANQNIPVKTIKEFELQLHLIGFWDIIYEVNNNDNVTANYYNNQLRKVIVPIFQEELPEGKEMIRRLPTIWDYLENNKDFKYLSVYISSVIKINGKEIEYKSLSNYLKNHINQSTIIEYVYSENATYQDYINALSAHKKAIWELRNTENYKDLVAQKRRNQFNRDEELNEEIQLIEAKYPFRITERFE